MEAQQTSGFSRPLAGEESAASLMTQYFGRVLVQEQISVARLVGYILTRTLSGDSEIEASYSDLETYLNLSRAAVCDALKQALVKGYIAQVREGANGHVKAVYALSWADQVQEAYQFDQQTSSPLESSIESFRIESLESSAEPVQPVNQSSKQLPAYLENLSELLSQELGDLQHQRSNRTQVYNLFSQSGLTEKEFAAALYQARDLTKRYAVHRPGEPPTPDGQPRNRMAYFFTVLRDKLFSRPDPPKPPVSNPKKGQMPASWLRFA